MTKKIIIKKKKTSLDIVNQTAEYIIELGQRLQKRENHLYTLDGEYVGRYLHDTNCPNCRLSKKCWYYVSFH